jgi:hypothetical protein
MYKLLEHWFSNYQIYGELYNIEINVHFKGNENVYKDNMKDIV